MGSIIRILAMKIAKKAVKVEPSDALTQMNADDVVTIIKAILF